MHSTPTSAPWLKMVVRVICDITAARQRNWIYLCVPDLTEAFYKYIEHHKKIPSCLFGQHGQNTLSKMSFARTTA
jgi:hypothetical protein